MKRLILWLLFPVVAVIAFIIPYLVISLIGLLFASYGEVISNINWFVVYIILIGSWWTMIFCHEYSDFIDKNA